MLSLFASLTHDYTLPHGPISLLLWSTIWKRVITMTTSVYLTVYDTVKNSRFFREFRSEFFVITRNILKECFLVTTCIVMFLS